MTFLKFGAIPIIGIVSAGTYFGIANVATNYYVFNIYGDKLNNYELYKYVSKNWNNTEKIKGLSSKITNLIIDETSRETKQQINSHYIITNFLRNLHLTSHKEIQATNAIKKIEDYSIKLSTRCGAGTGWFLDYIIPKNGKYPTKWFIATNAHVVNMYHFGDNPFNQSLPMSEGVNSCIVQGETHTPLLIAKDINNYKIEEYINDFSKYSEIWSDSSFQNYLKLKKHKYFVNAKQAHSENADFILSLNQLVYDVIEKPRLFYVPINFLGKPEGEKWNIWSNKKNYYKDFAVLEVEFEDEDSARILTNNFHAKYHEKSNQYKPLEMFSKELIQTHTGDDLINKKEDYFMAGYPSNSYDSYQSFGNYSPLKQTTSRLSYWEDINTDQYTGPIFLKNNFEQPIIGHVDVGSIDRMGSGTSTYWGGTHHMEWGYNYLLDKVELGPGASGSLVTDSTGTVLGLYRMQEAAKQLGFIEPLRSEGIIKNGKIITPKYDLILGAVGQKQSYKSQLDLYYPNEDSFLRNKWKNLSSI